MEGVRRAGEDTLTKVPGVGPLTAHKIKKYLKTL